MAIIICPKCGGRGCTGCRNGFVDLEELVLHRPSLPSRQKLDEFKKSHCPDCFEEFNSYLGQEFGSSFAMMYGLNIWLEMRNQRGKEVVV